MGFIELNEQKLETNKVVRDQKMGGLEKGRAQATRGLNINDRTGEHKTGKHIYTGLMRELPRDKWE